MDRLKNKVAIVTGAGQGIGRGIALRLAEESCFVVVSDIDEANAQKVADEIKQSGKKSIAIKCDVSKKMEVDNLIDKTVENFGALDILVNNAGIFPYKPFLEMAEEDWDKVLSVNLKSVFLSSQAAAKIMKEGSKIVDISSIASLVAFPQLAHYCASKGGMNGFVRALAVELAPKKINVNAIAPGAINTPGAGQSSDEGIKKQTISMIPLGRIGEPEDIANAVLFLASDEASYITGQILTVDGGWTIK
ncbi:TPA: SDR family oxidoreductase [Candidatus Berkelbacteria bacterium]|uniref:Short-chain dehydrogenase/reductase SDR, 3-oxoacyl-[acyl-carrier protein] reductase n=1 Tax=Berkelbacteria bacterium GW2011_GWE1_39_12 TaxID=1618337 RepID=A0A0G4B1Z5_9BACT|nr:MAG: short-chain dehydrogenase/reductase SDR, 3-oxoacyl-[acyl-carrier protein] reductase [Berkelbacteria bacterium GW2011_GWE1_39_12]HBO60630.1 SDR family oxidoreductase [Candidatus Berkelbacteria bacterium]